MLQQPLVSPEGIGFNSRRHRPTNAHDIIHRRRSQLIIIVFSFLLPSVHFLIQLETQNFSGQERILQVLGLNCDILWFIFQGLPFSSILFLLWFELDLIIAILISIYCKGRYIWCFLFFLLQG